MYLTNRSYVRPRIHEAQIKLYICLNHQTAFVQFSACTPRYPLDIVFAVNSAGTGATNTKFVFDFILNISEHINMAGGDVTIAVVYNGCSGGELVEEMGANSDSVKQHIASFKYPRFDQLIRDMRLKAVDSRRESKHIGVMFVTDRLSPEEYDKARLEMMRARFQKTAVFAVGIGDMVNGDQVRSLMAREGYYFHAYSFRTLLEVASPLLYNLCVFEA